MLTCPMCKKRVADVVKHCPRCGTDLTLLSDYVGHLQQGLERADSLTKQGDLAGAVWAYLEVLEVDPENTTARQQVAQVATAVRQFDRKAPGRRWLERLRRRAELRSRVHAWRPGRERISWTAMIAILFFVIGCFVFGYHLGYRAGQEIQGPTPAEVKD